MAQNGPPKENLDLKISLKGSYSHSLHLNKSCRRKIVAYTSICPGHKNEDNQLAAISSWNSLGLDVYSLNTAEEIHSMKGKYPSYVKFIPSTKTTSHIFGKPCMTINSMIDHFNAHNTGDIIMLINSDIILQSSISFMDKIKAIAESSIVIAHRVDYRNDFADKKKYTYGFDVFFIDKKYSHIFPPSIYSMGQTWWDYWVPYVSIKNKIPVFILQDDFAFHKEHGIQYKEKDWVKMTEYFKWENNIVGNSHQHINDIVRNEILNKSISFNL